LLRICSSMRSGTCDSMCSSICAPRPTLACARFPLRKLGVMDAFPTRNPKPYTSNRQQKHQKMQQTSRPKLSLN
jgi:hypothetical protein